MASIQQPPKVDDDAEVVVLDAEQTKTVVERLRGRTMYPKAIASLFTGVRRGELLAVRWTDIDLDGKQITINKAVEETKAGGLRIKTPKTKNGIRTIPLPDIVVEALREHRQRQLEIRLVLGAGKLPADALVFPKLDGSLQSPRAFSAEWADAAASIGLPDIVLHALRHTHASMLIDRGIDVVKISKGLGHANPAITRRVYAHLFRSRIRAPRRSTTPWSPCSPNEYVPRTGKNGTGRENDHFRCQSGANSGFSAPVCSHRQGAKCLILRRRKGGRVV